MTKYVHKNGRLYWYIRKVPVHIAEIDGRGLIKLSLKTSVYAPENVIGVDRYSDVEAIKSLLKKIDIHLLNMEVSAGTETKKQISENSAQSILIREELKTATIILDKLILLLSKVDH